MKMAARRQSILGAGVVLHWEGFAALFGIRTAQPGMEDVPP
jgi:hypothetical protein